MPPQGQGAGKAPCHRIRADTGKDTGKSGLCFQADGAIHFQRHEIPVVVLAGQLVQGILKCLRHQRMGLRGAGARVEGGENGFGLRFQGIRVGGAGKGVDGCRLRG